MMNTSTWHLPSYALQGPQVDPYASLGLGDHQLRLPSLHEIRKHCDPLLKEYPFPANEAALNADLDELVTLQGLRDSSQIAASTPCRERRPLSTFLKTRPGNTASFTDQHKVGGPCIQTGADLARWFENDTPLLGGWMALNDLLVKHKRPPTQQAFIWAALNAAISAALLAAWHYKWMEPSPRFKPRPSEVRSALTVLYAHDPSGSPITNPNGYAGVPRHPSYPSGHSTVGGATAAILKRFFPDDAAELDNLADNSGLARMWAGIHYRADHAFGVALGAAVAELVYPAS